MKKFRKHFTTVGWTFRNREVRAWTSIDSKFAPSPKSTNFYVKDDTGRFRKLDETQVLEGITN